MIDGPSIEVFDGMTVVGIHRAMSFAEPRMRELWQSFRLRVEEVEARSSDDFISMRIYDEPVGAAPYRPDDPGASERIWIPIQARGM